MILENIKIYLQNVQKNNFIINIILKTHLSFNIIFIQEPSWSVIHSIPSSTSCKRKELVGVPTGQSFPGILFRLATLQESLSTLTFTFLLYAFLFKMTFLTTRTYCVFPFSTVVQFSF